MTKKELKYQEYSKMMQIHQCHQIVYRIEDVTDD